MVCHRAYLANASMDNMTAERIRIEYVRIDQAALWDRNPKQHDIGALVQSVERYGWLGGV